MRKYFLSENGSTLLLVMGVIMVLSILMIPLIAHIDSGFLQSQASARYEQASSKSESAVRVVRRLMAVSAHTYYDDADIRLLVDNLKVGTFQDSEFKVVSEGQVTKSIEVVSKSGIGNLQRTKKTILPILTFPKAPSSSGGGDGPAAGSDGDEFYHEWAVAVSNAAYNTFYHACDNPETPAQSFYENMITNDPVLLAKYQEEFNDYIDYYVGDNLDTRLGDRLLPVSPATWTNDLSNVEPLSTYVGYNIDHYYATNSGYETEGIHSQVNVNINNTQSEKWIRVNKLASSDTAISVKGNLNFPHHLSGNRTVINGDVWVGGNITTLGGDSLTINGDVYVNGSMTISSYFTNVTINGDLIVGNKLSFNGIQTLNVQGDISTGTLANGGQIVNVLVGGSFITNSDAKFYSNLNRMSIGGEMSIGGKLIVESANEMTITGSINATNGINFANISDLQVVGSMISSGSIEYSSTIGSGTIGGDIISGNQISFQNIGNYTSGGLSVGGSIAASGNISFQPSSNIIIAGDLLTAGSMAFNNQISGKFHIGGILGAYSDVTFAGGGIANNSIPYPKNKFGGYYAGGTTKFPNDYHSWGGINVICIEFHTPNSGSGGGTGLEFGI